LPTVDPVALPTFLFIGADKAGSTWLFRMLRQHPLCFVPPAKDIYYFDRYYERGFGWYRSFFDDAHPSARAVGELSHDYLYSDVAAERIALTLPDVKIVVFLRAPVDRTFSEFLYLVRSGLARRDDLRSALRAFPEALDHSRYARYLPAYLERFPREQIGVFLYDDLEADPVDFAGEVFSFLDLELVDGVDYHERVLPAARPRSRVLARAVRAAATSVRVAGLPTLVGRAKSSSLARVLYAPYPAHARPRLTEAERAWLHTELDPGVEELETMLGLDLASWRSGQP
jgi:hypothetical protein